MLTPQDVKTKAFTKAVFGGYDMASVDDFLDSVAEDYGALYKENAILKNKLKVLVEKVEEYRNTEDSMRLALLSAQKLGKEMTAEAEARAKSIVENAEDDARKRIENLRVDTLEEERRLEAAKQRTAEFVEAAGKLCGEQLAFLNHINELTVTLEPAASAQEPAPNEEDRVDSTAKDIEDTLSRIFSETVGDTGEAEEEKKPVPTPAQSRPEEDPETLFKTKPVDARPQPQKPKFDFQNLQFGSNYDQKK